ncbi:MAG: dihydroorotase [Deltaproteobacteria bacterium GWA2_50_8]|nr:MAG: dihydroorotase [Deltaproteobacteria bacterium GWA2_50_8]
MKTSFILKDTTIINEGKIFESSVFIIGDRIEEIGQYEDLNVSKLDNIKIIDCKGKYLIPGIIDDQVHFREPGLTHKGDIYSESKAAVAGGITSFMEMPNTNPQTTTIEELNKKFKIASEKSFANYSFYLGATNDNIDELLKLDSSACFGDSTTLSNISFCNTNVCGIKVFMGSSTGNMLVDNVETLNNIFCKCKSLIAVHCEDEPIIQKNLSEAKQQYGDNIPISKHPEIRSREACFKSSSLAVELAKKYNTRLHLLHLSTKEEISLLTQSPCGDSAVAGFVSQSDALNLSKCRKDRKDLKRITSEVCVHHLWFNDSDYEKYGTKIKWNPAIKKESDRKALLNALKNNFIDIVATDHAPHTIEEKQNSYFKAPSGGPLVQHSLNVMLELYKKGEISLEQIIEKMCHNPARIFGVKNRGFIRKGYFADLVLVDMEKTYIVSKENILYKCKWSPFEATTFNSVVTHTFVNGKLVYNNGVFDESTKGMALEFESKS